MDDLDIKHLRAFVEVARDLSFTRAAARLELPQPRLSMRVQALEDQLGLSLLNRTSRKVVLTDHGRQFLECAARVVNAADGARAFADELLRGRGGQIRIGATSFRVWHRWELMHAFACKRPDVALHVELGNSGELLDRIRGGSIDLAFALGPVPSDLNGLLISKSRIGLTLPVRAPLAGRPAISLADLDGEKIAMFPPTPDVDLHDRLSAKIARHRIELVDLPEIHGEAMTQFVLQSGVGIISAQWWTAEHTPGMTFVPVDEISETLDLYLMAPKEGSGPAASGLWQLVEQQLHIETDR